jgi:hypothetical protein
MAKQGRRRNRQCAYCGEAKPSSRDHVIPRCLFPHPLPEDMVTVPACDDCNGRKSRHDDFLRDLLVTDFAGSQSPIAQQIFAAKTIRSHQQGKSLLGRIVMSDSMVELPIGDQAGEDDIAAIGTFDSERATEMFSFIVRGLYFSFRSVLLPQDCNFQVGRLFKGDLAKWVHLFNELGAFGPHRLGDGVFSCVYNYGDTSKAVTFWLLEFYDRVQYSVLTTPAQLQLKL